MYQVEIARTECIGCAVCADVCPVAAIGIAGDGGHPVACQVDECIGCGSCARECPTQAMAVRPLAETVPLASGRGATLAVIGPRTDPWGPLFRRAATSVGAPCESACPVGTDVGRLVALVGEGRLEEASAVASARNPFPSICGRVCTAPCELACRRAVVDAAVSIRELERVASDTPPADPVHRVPSLRAERVAIVGAGPCGLAAAYDLARAGYGVTVFDAMPVPGGMMAIGIPEYRLPRALLRSEIARILSLGVELRLGIALGRDLTLDALREAGHQAILLATGTAKSQRLGIPGEDAEGIWPATLFLKRANLGEELRLAGDALVVGGGSTAMDAARMAWRRGARSVRVLHRGHRSDMRAQAEEVRAAEHEGVVIDERMTPVAVVRSDGRMTGLRCVRSGDTTVTLAATNLLVAIGEAPDPSILPEGSSIEIASWGGVVVDTETLATAQPGVFAAGDLTTGPRSVVDGIAHGQRAARAVAAYLAGRRPRPVERDGSVARRPAVPSRVRVDLTRRPRALTALRPRGRPRGDTRAEVALGLDAQGARQEAARCLRCDVIDACETTEVIRDVSA